MFINTASFPYRRHALALALALVMTTGAADAATINVGGTCSLTAAINNANSDTDKDGADFGCPAGRGADRLILAPDTTYTLTTVDNSTDGPNGLPSISSVVTISGNHSLIRRAPDAPDFRLLHIAGNGELTLDKIVLSGGQQQDYYLSGGAIFSRGQLTLTNSTVSDNKVKFGYGGGIDNSGGKLTLTNSQVSGNTSFKGGGIYNTQGGAITLTDSTVSGNTAIGGGGGIYSAQKGVATLINSKVVGNKSESGQGGGIYVGGLSDETSSSLTLIKSKVSDNQAALSGGGINSYRSHVTLTNSMVSSNSAEDGGDSIASTSSALILTDSSVSAKSIKQDGDDISAYQSMARLGNSP